jgi:hypothetical protein
MEIKRQINSKTPFNHRRVSEVFRLLQSSRPIILNMQQRPEMNNHDFQVTIYFIALKFCQTERFSYIKIALSHKYLKKLYTIFN